MGRRSMASWSPLSGRPIVRSKIFSFGSAGEPCMSMPVIVPVGQKTAEAVRERLLQEIPKLRIGVATDPDAQMGPVVTAEHKKKIEGYIQLAIDEGAKLLIDGRGRSLPGHEEGFFLWPTLIDYATLSMKSYQNEIFGPVLQIFRADSHGGWKDSAFGDLNQYGEDSIRFFTRTKVVTQRWPHA